MHTAYPPAHGFAASQARFYEAEAAKRRRTAHLLARADMPERAAEQLAIAKRDDECAHWWRARDNAMPMAAE